MTRIPPASFAWQLGRIIVFFVVTGTVAPADDLVPKREEQQLPQAMHSADERAAPDHRGPGRDRPGRGRQPGAPGGRRLCRGTGRGDRRDRRGRVPDARFAAPALGRNGPWPERSDDPAQGRRGRLSAGPRRRLRRAADHGRGARRLHRRRRGRDLGRPRRRLPYHRGTDHGKPREHLLDRRAPDGRLHGCRPRQSGHRLPGGERHQYRGSERRGPRHRGEQGGQSRAQRMPGCGDLPLPRLRHGDSRLRRTELSWRRNQLPAVERRDRHRLHQ